MKAVGRRQRPDSWDARTSGTAIYTTDVRLPGMLAGRILRSTVPHAEIRSIDVTEALRLPGVAAVITAADLPDRTYLHLGEPFRDRHALARSRVRFIGEEVAAVAAKDESTAAAALELIKVDYAPLATVETPAAAMRDGAPILHDHAPDNIALRVKRTYGDAERAPTEADLVVHGAYSYGPATHLCMEPHSVVASWDQDQQRMDLWVSTQAPYFVRKEVAHFLDLDMDHVHTHEVAVGGGFGAKAKAGLHEVIAATLSRRAGRPVRIVLDRSEEFATTAARHPIQTELSTGARRDGTLTHRECRFVVENGAYNHAGPSVAIFATMLAASLYRVEACEADATLVYTNKQPGASFRGYGNPQVTFAMESQLDELADGLGIDRVELRIKNAHRDGDVTLAGWQLASARLVDCLERARDEIGWVEKQGLKGTGRGVGIAAAIHVSGANAFEHSERSEAALDVCPDGTVQLHFAGSDAGTGQATLLRQIAADELGVSFDDVSITMMDSEGAPQDLGAWSSRGTVFGGHAMANTAGEAARILRQTAGDKLGVSADDVQLVAGQARVGDDAIDLGDLVELCDRSGGGRLHVEGDYVTDVDKMNKSTGLGHFSPSYSFAVQAVEVEVDHDTGAVRVVDVVSVHDSGAALNPAGAEGQVAGAVVMGLGAALGEELMYEGGRLINPSYLDYSAPRASDVPDIRVILLDAHDPAGPHGAKGLGEIGLVPTPAAVANAVAHATGVRVRELPITPDKLLPALRPPSARPSIRRRPSLWWSELVRALYPRGLFRVLHRWGTRFARLEQGIEVAAVEMPTSVEAALASHTSDSAFIAGGTDLLVARQQGLSAPVRLIDLATIQALALLEERSDHALDIGAAVTLGDLGRFVAESGDPMLEELLGMLANHQIREMATVGGNLLQENRCSFYRNGFVCYKRGGWTCPCYAVVGEHRFQHAVIGGHRCQAVTPSDLATGFLALDAVISVVGQAGVRKIEVGSLYTGPGESALEPDEILTSVRLPAAARARHSVFEKLNMYAGDFAVCSTAVALELDGERIIDARVALGGVAPTPHRATRVEALIRGLDIGDVRALDEAAHSWSVDAHPLANNAWKVDAATGLLRRALRRLRSDVVGTGPYSS